MKYTNDTSEVVMIPVPRDGIKPVGWIKVGVGQTKDIPTSAVQAAEVNGLTKVGPVEEAIAEDQAQAEAEAEEVVVEADVEVEVSEDTEAEVKAEVSEIGETEVETKQVEESGE